MKGFKKDGKFRPTQKRYKPSLRKEDVKSFEDSHAENVARQVESRRMLLQHKETLDMHECTLCNQQFDKNDPLFDVRVSRHIAGRHQHHYVKGERPYQGDLISKSMMGGMVIGEAEFVPEEEKRNKESIDICDPATEIGNRGLNCKNVKEEYELDKEREEHFKTCNHPNCKETFKLRKEMGSNNQTFEQFEKHADADEFRHAFTEEES